MIVIDSLTAAEQHLDDTDAVIFDLDDTLYSEKEYVKSGYSKVAEYFEKPELAERMWIEFKKGNQAIDEALKIYGLIHLKDEALRVYRYHAPDIHLYDGAAELIKKLRNSKKVGIITDGRPEGQRAKIRALELEVDEIIVTDELGGTEYRKPNTAAFEIMQKKMNVDFNKMVYIGDNIKKDFIAPEKLGMKSIFFNNRDGIYYKEY